MSSNKKLKMGMLFAVVLAAGCASTPSPERKHEGEFDHLLSEKKDQVIDRDKQSLEQLKNVEEARGKAKDALNSGDVDKALFYYVKVLEFDNKNAEALLTIANIHSQKGNHGLSVSAYRILLSSEPDNVDALEGLGMSMLKLSKYGPAKKYLLQAVELDPSRVRALNGLGAIHDIEQNHVMAGLYFGKALQVAPDSPALINNLAYSRYLAGDWDKAEQLYLRVLKRNPSHYQTSLNYGLLQARRGDINSAFKTLEGVLGADNAYNEIGYILMMDKKYDQAAQLFEKAISASPAYFSQAYDNLERARALRAGSQPQYGSSSGSMVNIRDLPSVQLNTYDQGNENRNNQSRGEDRRRIVVPSSSSGARQSTPSHELF